MLAEGGSNERSDSNIIEFYTFYKELEKIC